MRGGAIESGADVDRAGVFISYRRQDADVAAGRLADSLSAIFGPGSIFRDLEALSPGTDYVEALDRALDRCAVLLVVIGPRWLHILRRRAGEERDWVTVEISRALARGIFVIPVLVSDSRMPQESDVPAELKPLLRRQAFEISDRSWSRQIAELAEALNKVPGMTRRVSASQRLAKALDRVPEVVTDGETPTQIAQWIRRGRQNTRATVAVYLVLVPMVIIGLGALVWLQRDVIRRIWEQPEIPLAAVELAPSLQWSDRGLPSSALVSGTPSVVGFVSGGRDSIHAFVTGSDGHLYASRRSGSQWQWVDQGLALGRASVKGTPAAVSFDDAGQRWIMVFVTGADGRLYVNWWDGSRWQWADQGLARGRAIEDGPGVVRSIEAGRQHVDAFVTASNGHLYVSRGDGSKWEWVDHGLASGRTPVRGTPSVVSFVDSGVRRIWAFVTGSDGHLYVRESDGSRWMWSDEGQPDTTVNSAPGVVTFVDQGTTSISAFVTGANGHLYVNWGSVVQRQWTDLGLASGRTPAHGAPSVVTRDGGSVRRPEAFVAGADGRLYMNWWNGSGWQWADQGPPPGTRVNGPPGAAAFLSSAGKQALHAFVRASDGRLYVNGSDEVR